MPAESTSLVAVTGFLISETSSSSDSSSDSYFCEPKEINLGLGVNADLVTNGDIFLVDLPLVDGVETFEGRFLAVCILVLFSLVSHSRYSTFWCFRFRGTVIGNLLFFNFSNWS